MKEREPRPEGKKLGVWWNEFLNSRTTEGDKQLLKERFDLVRGRIKEIADKTKEQVGVVGEKVKDGVRATGDLVEKSRESRLKVEGQTEVKNDQGKFVQGCLVFAGNTAMQMIPIPVGLAFWPTLTVGDLVTGYGVLIGRDLITQRKLDWIDRGLYALATGIPILPGTVLVEPLKLVRRSIEEAVHAHKEGDHETRNKHIGDIVSEGWKFVSHLKKNGKEKKS